MAATPVISMAAAEAMLNALTALMDSCYVSIYTGSPPATAETGASGTLLSKGAQLGGTAFGNATDGGSGAATASANSIASDTNALAGGTAGYFRIVTTEGGSTVIAQGTCGTSSADMILNTTTIVMGGTVAISSYVINMPDGSGSD